MPTPKQEVSRLIEMMRAPAQQAKPPPLRIDRPHGCVIILGGNPSVIVRHQGSQKT